MAWRREEWRLDLGVTWKKLMPNFTELAQTYWVVTTGISFLSEKLALKALLILNKNSIKLACQTCSWPQNMLSASLHGCVR